jgi:hypothetical protein
MAHYVDLSHCSYFPGLAVERLLSVGWLEVGFDFRRGDPGEAVYSRLKELLKEPWEPGQFMGGHNCQFCRYDGFYSYRNLFIPGAAVTFVAPEGIIHYIATHEYCPPAEFCDAVLACPEMSSARYFEALRSCGWSQELASGPEEVVRWRARRRKIETLKAIGNLLVCRIEEYREINGRLPLALSDIGDPLLIPGTWKYEPTEPARASAWHRGLRWWMFGLNSPQQQTYELSLSSTSPNDAELVWCSEDHRCWRWRHGNATTYLSSDV